MQNRSVNCLFPFLLFFIAKTDLTAQRVAGGRLERIRDFQSKHVSARNVDVWLPPGYEIGNPLPVLYFQDGQMLFDSTDTWNHQEWELDETASALIKQGRIKPFIIVGIWNGGQERHTDYFPQKPFESLSANSQDSMYQAQRPEGDPVFHGYKVHSDEYLTFLTLELKPYIDSHYATLPDAANTSIGGSSMGGLISWYAMCEYPDVFGAALCLSTHWPGTFNPQDNPIPQAFLNYLETHLPNADTHRIFFDRGTETLDSWYGPYQQQVDQLFRRKGFDDEHFMSRVFPGDDHSEKSWASRMTIPLEFILGY